MAALRRGKVELKSAGILILSSKDLKGLSGISRLFRCSVEMSLDDVDFVDQAELGFFF